MDGDWGWTLVATGPESAFLAAQYRQIALTIGLLLLTGVIIAWSVGLSLYSAVVISTTDQILEPMSAELQQGGAIRQLVGHQGG